MHALEIASEQSLGKFRHPKADARGPTKLESTHYRCSRPPFRQVSGEDEDLSALGVPLDAVVKVDVGMRSWEVSKGGHTFVVQKYRGLNPVMSHLSAQSF